MAESAIPTFKLVLVGDGGTGKVSYLLQEAVFSAT
jgi:GTPase SAR1 family protein